MITFAVETLGAVASTNDLLHERALAGADEGLVIRAEAQTAGRGRHGRIWVSPEGNLYASVLLRPLRPIDEAASLSLIIALSLAEALTQLVPEANLSPRLKWPNDVRLSGAKIAGILLENAGTDPARPVIVAGLGVNVTEAPQGMPYKVTSLRAAGVHATPERVLERYLENFAANYALWQAAGFAALRSRWLGMADGLGERVEIRRGETTIEGRFVDIDPAGYLVLETQNGVETFPAGELLLEPGRDGR